MELKRLAKLGITTSLDTIDADVAEGLIIVDSYLDELREIDAEADKRKTKKRGSA